MSVAGRCSGIDQRAGWIKRQSRGLGRLGGGGGVARGDSSCCVSVGESLESRLFASDVQAFVGWYVCASGAVGSARHASGQLRERSPRFLYRRPNRLASPARVPPVRPPPHCTPRSVDCPGAIARRTDDAIGSTGYRRRLPTGGHRSRFFRWRGHASRAVRRVTLSGRPTAPGRAGSPGRSRMSPASGLPRRSRR